MTFHEKHVLARNEIQSSRLGFRVCFSSICCLLGYREVNIDADLCEHGSFSSACLCLFPNPRKADNPTVSSCLTLSASCRNPPSFQDEFSYPCTWIHPVIQNYCVFSLRWGYCSHALAPSPDICKRPHCEVSSTLSQPPLPLLLAKAPSSHAPQAVLSGSVPTSTSRSDAAGWWLTVSPTGSSSSVGLELLGLDVDMHTPEPPLPGFCSPSLIIFSQHL